MCDIRSFEVAKYEMRIQVQGDKRKPVYILCEHKQNKQPWFCFSHLRG